MERALAAAGPEPGASVLVLGAVWRGLTLISTNRLTQDIEFNERFPNAGNTSSVSITKLAPAAKVRRPQAGAVASA